MLVLGLRKIFFRFNIMHLISIYSLQQATQFWAILGYSPTVLLITVCSDYSEG